MVVAPGNAMAPISQSSLGNSPVDEASLTGWTVECMACGARATADTVSKLRAIDSAKAMGWTIKTYFDGFAVELCPACLPQDVKPK